MIERMVGSTVIVSWVNSGAVVDSIHSYMYDGNEVLVHSATMISSGDGHFYNYVEVNTAGFYSLRTRAYIDEHPFINQQMLKVRNFEVD